MIDFKYVHGIYLARQNELDIKIVANKNIFSKISENALNQLISISKIPHVYKQIIGLPDIHDGFGVPIGSCFASDCDNGVISSEAVGYDINCGVRLVKTDLFLDDLSEAQLTNIAKEWNMLPLGLSSNGLSVTHSELSDILTSGIKWAMSNNYCEKKDVQKTDYRGCLSGADVVCLSKEALLRGKLQIGTLGQGNHFLDLVSVSEIFDAKSAKKQGLKKNQVCIMLHTGSRGLGYQVASDYNKLFEHKLPISHQEFNSDLGKKYYCAMQAAANFAFVNRAVFSQLAQTAIEKALNIEPADLSAELVRDLSHNLATIERHDGKQLIVHRKGASRTTLDKPIILPGSMMAESYLMMPLSAAEKQTFSTIAHGAGRQLSRTDAKSAISFKNLKALMQSKKIILAGKSENLMREEQPFAYKPSKEVVSSIELAGLAKNVLSLRPIIVATG